MSPLERQMYELFGGEQAYMRNVMKMYNSDGDYVGADGSTVPGMVATGIPESERHQMINVSEEYRQKMTWLKKSLSGKMELLTGISRIGHLCTVSIS